MATPTATAQGYVDEVMVILRDPNLKGDAHTKAKKDKVFEVISKAFDFKALSQRTLPQRWKTLSTEDQEVFVQLLTKLLAKIYIDKLLQYNDQEIVISKEKMPGNNSAEVHTLVVSKVNEIPIVYHMMPKGEEWKVYDVIIEVASLVSNYRAQFDQYLIKNTFPNLLDELRRKTANE